MDLETKLIDTNFANLTPEEKKLKLYGQQNKRLTIF